MPRYRRAELYVVRDDYGEIRYAGVSWNARRRQRNAWTRRYSGRTKKGNPYPFQKWLRTLQKPPLVQVIAIVEYSDRFSWETKLIRKLQSIGCDLLNEVAAYGEKSIHTHSAAVKLKMAESRRKAWATGTYDESDFTRKKR